MSRDQHGPISGERAAAGPAPADQERAERERVRRLMEHPAAVFVFGANLAGRHGAGAALDAVRLYGAERGRGVGPMGRSYAIPTKGASLHTLPLPLIAWHVGTFCQYARHQPSTPFVVTRIGCGLAGWTDADIAPLFRDAPDNCHLPLGWRDMAASKENNR